MRILDVSHVGPTEIDGLGHMNVRFYMERAQRANLALMDLLGLGADRLGVVKLLPTDTYCRYQREQVEGAALTVNGGVLSAQGNAIRVYLELLNPTKTEVAATFIMTNSLLGKASGKATSIPGHALAAAYSLQVELPERGRARTIPLGPLNVDLSLEEVEARLSDDPSDFMSRSMESVVTADECDEYGFLAEHQDLMFGFRRRSGASDGAAFGPMTFVLENGQRYGWASLETRNVRVSQPRVGDTLRSIGGEVGLQSKVRHSRRWLFNVETGRLASLNDNVSIALDLDARRPMEIPGHVRETLQNRHVPELAE